jgi:hypothetical protein
MAAQALKHIAELYQIETADRDLSIEDRQQIRHEKALPVLAELHSFLTQARVKAPPEGASAKAIDYKLEALGITGALCS